LLRGVVGHEHRATLENMIQQIGDVMTAKEALECLRVGKNS